MQGKLTRSRTDRIIAGVCGGLAANLGVETFWIRLLFVLGGGIFFWIYIALALLIPYGPDDWHDDFEDY